MKNREVAIVSVGLHPWGVWPDKSQPELAVEAMSSALEKAHMDWKEIEFLITGNPLWIHDREGLNGVLSATAIESVMGDRGLPVISMVNACATSQALLNTACMAIASGEYDVVMVAAGDKSAGGFFHPQSADARFDPDYIRFVSVGFSNPSYWAAEVRRRMQEVGTTDDDLAMIKVITSKAAVYNKYARYKRAFSKEDVLNSPMVCDPLHLLEIVATSDGGGAMIVTSLDKAKKYTDKPILVEGVAIGSASFGDPTIRLYSMSTYPVPGVPMASESVNCLKRCYDMARKQYHRHLPEDIDIIELPDNSSWHYLVYVGHELGLKPAEVDKMLRRGDFDPIDGKIPVCPSGGFGGSGEATACQGIYQMNTIIDQLRGEAGKGQVKKEVKLALAQVYGYAGNNAACLLSRAW